MCHGFGSKKQSFLHRVLGVRQRAEHAVTVEQQLAARTLDVSSELVHYVPPFQRWPMGEHRFLLVIPERGQKLIAQ
jgi:hypothetical protein